MTCYADLSSVSSYDIEYPVECDDEYWEHPDPQKNFQQPEGKPSVYAFTVAYCKLVEILGMAQKTIVSRLPRVVFARDRLMVLQYSVKRIQRSTEWSQAAVAELE